MGRSCAIKGCGSSSTNGKDRHFYTFPPDEIRSRQWIQATGRPELENKGTMWLNKNYFICDLHFEVSDRLRKNLKKYAIPKLNLLPEIINPCKITQTDVNFKSQKEASTQVNMFISEELKLKTSKGTKRKSKKDLKNEVKRPKFLENEQMYPLNYKNISPTLQKLIELQFKLNSREYYKQYKLLALNIYFASPLAYRVLGKTLNLPSERILRRMRIDMGTKLYPGVLDCLKSKLKNLKEADKYCIVCADEISLKRNLHYQINEDKIIGFHEIDGVQTAEPASQAFVVMARGLLSNWKQPIGYSLLAQRKNYKELNKWLDDVISKMIEMGFNVVAFVSDQRSNFWNLANKRGVSVEKPYFHLNGKKIFYIFDVPHLVKSIRNELMNNDFEFLDIDETKLTAKWEDVKNFYCADSQRSHRLAPKLTESHISPNNFEKMKVKTATQVFSYTVAAAMSFLIECGQLEKSAIGTVKLIELIDKAFDILNSCALNESNKYKNAFASKPYQNELLDRFESFLTTVTVLNKNQKNVTNTIKCLKGLQISLHSIKCLAKELKTEGFRFLCTKRLNQEPLEMFFESVRQQSGNCRKPTPIKFTRAFRKLFMVNLLRHSENANCSDYHRLLMTGDMTIQPDSEQQSQPGTSTKLASGSLALTVGTIDYRFDLPEKNAFLYVSGYLLYKCVAMHKCKKMLNLIQLIQCTQEQHAPDIFISNKYFNENSTFLLNPSNNFVDYVKEMDNIVKHCFQQQFLDRVGNQILKELKNLSSDECCECFPNEYLKKLFIRFRIFNIIQFNNRCFKDKSMKRKYFSIPNL